MINHELNARIHRLPFCPECLAKKRTACTNPNGTRREPHRVRLLVVEGIVVVKRSRRWASMVAK